jgi:hypothetical protein
MDWYSSIESVWPDGLDKYLETVEDLDDLEVAPYIRYR